MQCMLIPFLLFIEACILIVVNPTMSTVSGECPTNEASWMQRSTEVCNNSQEYHCLPTIFLNESVEICLTVKLLQRGFCGIYNPYQTDARIDFISSCVSNTNFSGCPTKSYYSNETYLHPSCQKINPAKQCYLADSSCPNITSNDPKVASNQKDIAITRDTTTSPGSGPSSDAWSLSPLVLIYLISGLVFIQF
ncbi:uncharacterized protein [Magallana gigas]|uniref:uncharacterized protein isoform X2 n=1 Tax=Magallana gigas TaxID=29159 RepID=UPI00333E2E90